MSTTAFQKAELYELLGNRDGRLDREGPFLLEALVAAPERKVADLACGLGLHAEFLAKHGGVISAFDLSPEMIAYAAATRPHPGIRWAVADMCAPTGGPFGMILCIGNALCLLENLRQVEQFFQNAYERLHPGGSLITQTLNYEAAGMKKPRVRVEKTALHDGEVVAVKRFLPHGEQTEITIDYLWATSRETGETRESFSLHHWNADQLRASADTAGFIVNGSFGNYNKSPLLPDSVDIIFSFCRPLHKQ